MAGRDSLEDRLSASEDPLCLSLRGRELFSRRLSEAPALASPPTRETPCLSPEDDLRPPARERTWFRRLGETQALASLPSIGETKRGLSLHRRRPIPGGWRNPGPCVSPCKQDPFCLSPGDDLRPPARERTWFPEAERNTGPCVSPLHRGEQEGSSDARILRFPHRWTDPRGEVEHRSPAGLALNPWYPPLSFRNAQTQESQNRRGPVIRGPAGRSRCLRACRAGRRFPSTFFGRSKRGHLPFEPRGRLDGMSLWADWGDHRLDGTGKDTFSDLHRSETVLRRSVVAAPEDTEPPSARRRRWSPG